ncbi:DinB family protein [Nonomuraea bangladeshensis]|uniref:DinB family protein n=1 Tax=Nonomuraea bangladeshensis TaxID=404385 RepID=UPI0031DED34F
MSEEIIWNPLLRDQFAWHWTQQLRPRLDGLSDEEYFWEPAPGSWNVRPRGTGSAPIQGGTGAVTIDFAFPMPEPAPFTTIAWRLGHVIVGVLAMRNAAHFGRAATDYHSYEYAATAAEAGLARPCGEAEGEWAAHPMAALVLHINRELIHHLSEVCLLRDLYLHTTGQKEKSDHGA